MNRKGGEVLDMREVGESHSRELHTSTLAVSSEWQTGHLSTAVHSIHSMQYSDIH